MSNPGEFDLVHRGPLYRLGLRFGVGAPNRTGHLQKVLILILVTWLPLLILSLAAGHAFGDRVAVALLRDPVVLSRFLFVVPLLSVADLLVARSLEVQSRAFVASGVVPVQSLDDLVAAREEAIRLRESVVAEGVILFLAFAVAITARLVVALGAESSTWERAGTAITLAGWWYMLVSLPILFFLLLRWLWVFLVWSWFLFRVSRLSLELTPTHPDRAGGLGFLGWGIASFAIVLMAISAVVSGGFAYEIVHRGSSLHVLKYHVIVFVVLAIGVLQAPLFVFVGTLARCRFRGLLDYGALIGHHDRAFDARWVKNQGAIRERLLGSPEVASLADIAQVYEHVNRMQLLPFDKKALIVQVTAALIPMIPLLGTVMGLTDILTMLGKFLV